MASKKRILEQRLQQEQQHQQQLGDAIRVRRELPVPEMLIAARWVELEAEGTGDRLRSGVTHQIPSHLLRLA